MMIVVVIMRQGRTALKDMEAIMVMRMTAIPEALIIKIHDVDDDDTADALGRNEGYVVFCGLQVTKDGFKSILMNLRVMAYCPAVLWRCW